MGRPPTSNFWGDRPPVPPRSPPLMWRTDSGQPIPPGMPLKNLKCAKGIPLNCGKGLKSHVGHCVTCTSICLVLRSLTVENQLAELLFLHNASLLCYNKSYQLFGSSFMELDPFQK